MRLSVVLHIFAFLFLSDQTGPIADNCLVPHAQRRHERAKSGVAGLRDYQVAFAEIYFWS